MLQAGSWPKFVQSNSPFSFHLINQIFTKQISAVETVDDLWELVTSLWAICSFPVAQRMSNLVHEL